MNLQPNSIKYSYPITIYSNINIEVKELINKLVSDFYNNLPKEKIGDLEYTLNITYDTKIYKDYTTYIFYIDTYTGGAHSNNKVITFTYHKKERVYIKKIIGNNIEKLSNYIRNDLYKRKGFLKDMVEEGTTANLYNYKNFYYDEKGITFIFNPYQVAPYVYGFIEITVPYSLFE
jgi:Protein of unknown function (DUF3298).